MDSEPGAHGDPQVVSGLRDCLGTLSVLEVAQVSPQRFWVVNLEEALGTSLEE